MQTLQSPGQVGLASAVFGKASALVVHLSTRETTVSWMSQPITSHQPSDGHPRLLLRLKSQGVSGGCFGETERLRRIAEVSVPLGMTELKGDSGVETTSPPPKDSQVWGLEGQVGSAGLPLCGSNLKQANTMGEVCPVAWLGLQQSRVSTPAGPTAPGKPTETRTEARASWEDCATLICLGGKEGWDSDGGWRGSCWGSGRGGCSQKGCSEVTAWTEPREGTGVSILVPWGQLGLATFFGQALYPYHLFLQRPCKVGGFPFYRRQKDKKDIREMSLPSVTQSSPKRRVRMPRDGSPRGSGRLCTQRHGGGGVPELPSGNVVQGWKGPGPLCRTVGGLREGSSSPAPTRPR